MKLTQSVALLQPHLIVHQMKAIQCSRSSFLIVLLSAQCLFFEGISNLEKNHSSSNNFLNQSVLLDLWTASVLRFTKLYHLLSSGSPFDSTIGIHSSILPSSTSSRACIFAIFISLFLKPSLFSKCTNAEWFRSSREVRTCFSALQRSDSDLTCPGSYLPKKHGLLQIFHEN